MPEVAYETKYGKGPHVTVDVVAITETSVLLIQRKDGVWALPGGFVKSDQTLQQAASAELFEETSIKGYFWGLQPVIYDRIDRDPRSRMITFVFVINEERFDFARPKAGDDAINADWISLRDAYKLSLYADHNVILVDAVIAQHGMDK